MFERAVSSTNEVAERSVPGVTATVVVVPLAIVATPLTLAKLRRPEVLSAQDDVPVLTAWSAVPLLELK